MAILSNTPAACVVSHRSGFSLIQLWRKLEVKFFICLILSSEIWIRDAFLKGTLRTAGFWRHKRDNVFQVKVCQAISPSFVWLHTFWDLQDWWAGIRLFVLVRVWVTVNPLFCGIILVHYWPPAACLHANCRINTVVDLAFCNSLHVSSCISTSEKQLTETHFRKYLHDVIVLCGY